MSDKVLIEGDVAYLAGAKMTVFMESDEAVRPTQRSSSPKVKDTNSSEEIAPWGENNDFPQQVIEAAEKNTEIASLIDFKVRATYARGVYPCQITGYDKNGNEVLAPVNDPEIRTFMCKSNLNRYLLEALVDFYWFFNVFPQIIKNVKGDKIVQIAVQEASYSRWSKMNEKGICPNVYVNAQFGKGAKASDKETLKFTAIDPYDFDRVENFKESTDKSAIYPISYPTPGKSFYQIVHWHGFIASEWYAVTAAIPKFKVALMKHQVAIGYHIRIPASFWPIYAKLMGKDWNNLTMEERKALKKQKLDEMNKFLTNVENAGKAFMSEYATSASGEKMHGWEIIPIEDKLKEGAYIEDSQEASAHLMRAMGLDATLVGAGPGRNMGAGSGSDKRIAFNIYVALLQPYRDVILEPLNFISDYNGWTERIEGLTWRFREAKLETLDKGQGTAVEQIN